MAQKKWYLTECQSCSFTLKVNGNFCRTVKFQKQQSKRRKEQKEQHNSTISHHDILFAYITIIEANLVWYPSSYRFQTLSLNFIIALTTIQISATLQFLAWTTTLLKELISHLACLVKYSTSLHIYALTDAPTPQTTDENKHFNPWSSRIYCRSVAY